MIVTIHQPQYLPWLGYFDKADRADVFILLDDVQYKKNDWQNRNKIKTAQGWQWLTVPIIHNFGQKIMDVQIDNHKNWKKAHCQALSQNYSKALFFDRYMNDLEVIYAQDWSSLVDINVVLIEKIIQWFGITTQIIRSSNYAVTEESTQRLIDLCRHCQADTYLSGADGEKYLQFEKFKSNNIKVVIQDYRHPVYRQMWTKTESGFLTHMTALDLLFNHGPESLGILRNMSINRELE